MTFQATAWRTSDCGKEWLGYTAQLQPGFERLAIQADRAHACRDPRRRVRWPRAVDPAVRRACRPLVSTSFDVRVLAPDDVSLGVVGEVQGHVRPPGSWEDVRSGRRFLGLRIQGT